jgi:flavin-dependent dehydrogenase
MSDTYDAIIIGGGPGGSSLGGILAMSGRRPLIVEREAFPRFHIGESLLPQSCEIFHKLGVTDDLDRRFMKKYGATFVCNRTGRQGRYLFSEAFDRRYPYAYQVPRAEFDMLLLDRAKELGAEVRQPCKVADVVFDGERAIGVMVQDEDGGRHELRAPVVVDASGRGSMMASHMRSRSRLQGLEQTAVFAHYLGVPRAEGQAEGDIRIVVFEHGWIWIIPFQGEITSVGMVVSREWMNEKGKSESLDDFFDRTMELSPFMLELLAESERTGPTRAAADFSYGVSQLVGDGWLCVGDSCGFIDPLFSSGAHLAIKGADLAAGAIDRALTAGDTSRAAFTDYEERMREASNMFLGAVQAFYTGELRELLFQADPRRTLRQVITSMLSGDVVHDLGKPPTWVRFVRSRFPARPTV